MKSIDLQRSNNGLTLKLPRAVSGVPKPCISIVATISVRPGLTLSDLLVSASTSHIQVSPSLDFTILETASLSSISGSISNSPGIPASTFYSRKTVIRTTSGAITGQYPLYDLLSAHTVSGNIDISVHPRDASASSPNTPAAFVAGTVSGDITTDYPTSLSAVSDIPAREYTVSVESRSGSVRGNYLHGTYTSLRSVSGSIDAILAPYSAVDKITAVETETKSGSTRLSVLASLNHSEAAMRKLKYEHESLSGGANLRFPGTWEGNIEAKSMSGALNVKWDGVEIIKDGRDKAWRKLEARRGTGKSEGLIRYKSLSGSLDLAGD